MTHQPFDDKTSLVVLAVIQEKKLQYTSNCRIGTVLYQIFLVRKFIQLFERYSLCFIKRFSLNCISHRILGGCVSRRIPFSANVVEGAQEIEAQARQGKLNVSQCWIAL